MCDFEFVQGSVVQVPSGVTDTALAPGQMGSFVNYTPAPRAEVANVNTWTTWEEADPVQPASTTRLLSWHRLVADVKSVPALDAKAERGCETPRFNVCEKRLAVMTPGSPVGICSLFVSPGAGHQRSPTVRLKPGTLHGTADTTIHVCPASAADR